MKIYIPTMGRTDRQKTWEFIPEIWKDNTFLVCPPNEVGAHEKEGRNAIAHPEECKGIGPVRQWIVENAPEKFIMTDDDHFFYRRPVVSEPKLVKATLDDMCYLFDWFDEILNKFSHAGLSARQQNHTWLYPYKDVTRQNNFHAFRRSTLIEHDIRFDEIPLMEDFWVICHLLRLGYPNRVIYSMTYNQAGRSNYRGGCSEYRNSELQEESARRLAEEFPGYVHLVKRQSKSAWEGMTERTDVRIMWEKLYKFSQQESEKSGFF